MDFNGIFCPSCKSKNKGFDRGILFFVRFWLNREIRECDKCHVQYSFNLE